MVGFGSIDGGWQYLCKDGEIRLRISGVGGFLSPAAILADPTSAYYESEAAALAAIHAHYHDGDTEVIDQIPATLESEECG